MVAVVGVVGSGKSSLLSAVIAQIPQEKGTLSVDGSVAYVPAAVTHSLPYIIFFVGRYVAQSSWVPNMTIRDNILFGLPYDAVKYHECIRTCALQPDLDLLPAKDMTEVAWA